MASADLEDHLFGCCLWNFSYVCQKDTAKGSELIGAEHRRALSNESASGSVLLQSHLPQCFIWGANLTWLLSMKQHNVSFGIPPPQNVSGGEKKKKKYLCQKGVTCSGG